MWHVFIAKHNVKYNSKKIESENITENIFGTRAEMVPTLICSSDRFVFRQIVCDVSDTHSTSNLCMIRKIMTLFCVSFYHNDLKRFP